MPMLGILIPTKLGQAHQRGAARFGKLDKPARANLTPRLSYVTICERSHHDMETRILDVHLRFEVKGAAESNNMVEQLQREVAQDGAVCHGVNMPQHPHTCAN